MVIRPTDSPARHRMMASLPQDDRVFTQKTFKRGLVKATRSSFPDLDLVERETDDKAEDYVNPPPWAVKMAKFTYRHCPARKASVQRRHSEPTLKKRTPTRPEEKRECTP